MFSLSRCYKLLRDSRKDKTREYGKVYRSQNAAKIREAKGATQKLMQKASLRGTSSTEPRMQTY